MCVKRMDRIDRMTEMLKSCNTGEHIISNVKKLDVEEGTAIAVNIFRPVDESISSAHTRAWPDTKFLEHYHNEQEIITVFKGDLTMVINGNENILTAGNTMVIKPKTAHYAFTKKGCEFIAITIPASIGFPK